MKTAKLAAAVSVACLMVPGIASATNGYFQNGYGVKEKGRGGASYAVADDAMGGANNPATMAFAGDRFDLGLNLFMPWRSASRSGDPFNPAANFSSQSGNDYFFIPEGGYNHVLNDKWTVGVTIYGNGGIDTQYPANGSGSAVPPCGQNLLCGSGTLGVDLIQMIVAPVATYKINPSNSIGIAPLFGYQRFKATGLQAFSGISNNPHDLTNRSYDHSFGIGVRIGWMGKITDQLSLGVTYSPKMLMSKFNRYSGLLAEGGGFDIPSHGGAGIAYQATPDLLLALDYERINYHDIRSINNPSFNGTALGTTTGRGFGWQNVNVERIGAEYKLTDRLTVRAGYDHSDNPIQPQDVTFNILAPGVVKDHMAFGATYDVTPHSELSFVYFHAFENSVTGPTNPLLNGGFAGGTDTIKLSEDNIGLGYGYKF